MNTTIPADLFGIEIGIRGNDSGVMLPRTYSSYDFAEAEALQRRNAPGRWASVRQIAQADSVTFTRDEADAMTLAVQMADHFAGLFGCDDGGELRAAITAATAALELRGLAHPFRPEMVGVDEAEAGAIGAEGFIPTDLLDSIDGFADESVRTGSDALALVRDGLELLDRVTDMETAPMPADTLLVNLATGALLSVRVTIIRPDDAPCGQCEGTGSTDAMGHPEECPVCNGTGTLEGER